jgi:hypothetical protein
MPEVDPATVENAGRWAGHYFDDAYGHVEVRKGRTGLEFRWAHYRGDLLPAGDGKFRLVNLNCALLADGEGVEFQPEGDGVLLFLGRRFAAVSSVEARSKSTSRPVAASHAAHRRSNRKTSTVR